MSSLKMTFSLASLVLIIGLVATAPVMAQEDVAVLLTGVTATNINTAARSSR